MGKKNKAKPLLTFSILAENDQYCLVMLPTSPHSLVGDLKWISKSSVSDQKSADSSFLSSSALSISDICSSNPSHQEDIIDTHCQIIYALASEPDLLLGSKPKKKDLKHLVPVLDTAVEQLENFIYGQGESSSVDGKVDDRTELLNWAVEQLYTVANDCGHIQCLHDIFEEDEVEAFLNDDLFLHLSTFSNPEAEVARLGELTASTLAELFDTLPPGHTHLTVSSTDSVSALTVEKTVLEMATDGDVEQFAWVLMSGFVLGGGLILRTLTDQLHSDGVTLLSEVRGYYLQDEQIHPLTEAQIFSDHSTDSQTQELLPPEHGVVFCSAWPLTKFYPYQAQ